MERRVEKRRGIFVVIDGLDAIGKGEIIRAIDAYEQKRGRAVFDTVAFSKANRKGLPELKDFWNPPETYYDTIITAEPTYAGIGHSIRHEIISNKGGRKYPSEIETEAYSIDRLILMTRVVEPALENGLNVLQSRSCAATMTYQSLRAKEEGKDEEKVRRKILSHEGNRYQLERVAPNLLIIPTIKSAETVMERLRARKDHEKDDQSIFDNLKFQQKLKPLYESEWLRKIFEKHGTTVRYLDAGISEQSSRQQAVEIYKEYLSTLRQN